MRKRAAKFNVHCWAFWAAGSLFAKCEKWQPLEHFCSTRKRAFFLSWTLASPWKRTNDWIQLQIRNVWQEEEFNLLKAFSNRIIISMKVSDIFAALYRCTCRTSCLIALFNLKSKTEAGLRTWCKRWAVTFEGFFCSRSLTASAGLIPGRAASVEAGKLMMSLKLNVESTLIKKQIRQKMKFQ